VLRLRFGLSGEDPKTLSEIGEELGLTRERVRQIERDALKQLSEKLAF
jgi:RNA polymerase primary sigma factor